MKQLPFKNAKDFEMNVAVPDLDKYHELFDQAIQSDKADTLIVESFTGLTEIIYREARKRYKGYDLWDFYNREAKPDVLVWKGPTIADRFLDSIIGMNMPDGKHGHRYAYDRRSLGVLLCADGQFTSGPAQYLGPEQFVETQSKRKDHEIMIEVHKV